jgi:hypothetical protein
MRVHVRYLGAALLLALASAAHAVAQDAYVYYDHHPGPASLDARLSYVGTGRGAGLRIGRPPSLSVRVGSQLCIRVDNRNEVLYAYSITAKDFPADTIPGLRALSDRLTSAILLRAQAANAAREAARFRSPANPTDAAARAQAAQAPEPDPYLGPVAELYAKLVEMQGYQLSSDTVTDFARAAGEIARLNGQAADLHRTANAALARLGADTATPEVRLIRVVHADVWVRIGVIANRFHHALGTSGDPLCATVGTSRVRVTLKIARSTVDPSGAPQRPVGDSVVTLVVAPRDDRAFLLEPGTILSVFTQDRSTIGLAGGLVAQTPNHGVGVHPGVFAMARAGSIRWLWVTVGAATGDDAVVSDIFIGLTFRGGSSLVGGRVGAGIGLALSRVPVGVSKGSVGSALPTDVKNVEDIIQREFRPGLGVTFAIQVP